MIPRAIQERLQATRPRFAPALFRGVLWAIAVSAIAVPLLLLALPYVEFFNGMAAQPKGRTQGTYGRLFGAEIPVDMAPPAGTAAQAVAWPRFTEADEETARAAEQALRNPYPTAMPSLLRGQELYNTFCITCHGKAGDGDGPVVGPDRYPAPTSLHDPTVRGYGDGRIYHVISRGHGKMKGYADKIAADERWHVVNYVRALQRARNPRPEDLSR